MRINKTQATTFRFGNPRFAMRNSDDSESRRPETRTTTTTSTTPSKGLSPTMVSVVLAVISVVFSAVPSHGFSTVPAAAAATGTTPIAILSEEDCVRDQLGYLPSNYVGLSAWKKKPKGSHRKGIRIDTAANTTTAEGRHPYTTDLIPVAIQTYPLNGGAKRRQNKAKLPVNDANRNKKSVVQSPFPTLFWLTCPDIARAVANLERRGFVHIFEDELNSHPDLAQRLFSCHEEYAQLRWRSLTEDDRKILTSSSSSLTPSLQRMRNMMECSGISGTNFTDISSWDSDYSTKAAAGSAVAAQINQRENQNGDPTKEDTPPSTPEVVVAKVPPIKCLHAHYAHYRSTVSLDSTRHINPVGELIHRQLELDFPDLDL